MVAHPSVAKFAVRFVEAYVINSGHLQASQLCLVS